MTDPSFKPAATPREFAQFYHRACETLSAEATAAYWGDNLMRYLPDGLTQDRGSKADQIKYLSETYEMLKQQGIAGIASTDYTITQLSDAFAVVRFRWELKKVDGTVSGGINSAYVIRKEENGWVAISNLELGEAKGP